jgi:hypothetical protein
VFKLVPKVASTLQTALISVEKLAKDPATIETFKVLGANDLATFGASGFVGLGGLLRTVAQAQFACDVLPIWARNFASTTSEGNAAGTWVRFSPLINLPEDLGKQSTPFAGIHANPYPVEQSGTCQAGNEGFSPGNNIGAPASVLGHTVDSTATPADILARGRAAGLVP